MSAVQDRTAYVAHESDDAKSLSHDDYLGFLEEATARIVGANPDTIANHATRNDGQYATDYQGFGGTSALSETVTHNPDLVYDTSAFFVVGEAKSTLSECTKKSFVSQIYDYVKLACESDAERRYVVLSVPFCGLGETKLAVAKALRQLVAAQELDDESTHALSEILASQGASAAKGYGSMSLSYDPANLGKGEVCIAYCSEIDGKSVPAPDGEEGDCGMPRFEDVGYESNSYEDLGSTRYPVMRTTVSIHDDRLRFDPLNNRLLGSERRPLTQEECYERLLSDGDIDSKNRSDAHQRRRDIINGLSIHQPVDLFLDDEGNLSVVDGNSRLSEALYVSEHAAEGTACGFARLKANVFSHESGITREQIDAIKNARQHEVKVDHDKIQDAFVIYDKFVHDHWDTERIRSYFGGLYSDRVIDGSIETIRRLKEEGLDDEHVKALYDSMWWLSNAGLGKTGAKASAVSNKDWKRISRRLVVEKGLVDSGAVDERKSYLSGSQFSKTVPIVMKATRKSDARKALLDRWIDGNEDLSSPEDFAAELKVTSKRRSVREQQMEYLKRIERDIDAVNAFLSTVVYENDEDIKAVSGLSPRDMRAMHSTISEVMKKANMLRAMNRALGEHV